MEIEEHNGYTIVVRHTFPISKILPGQVWQSSGGSQVVIISTDGKEWVKYSWYEGDKNIEYEKQSFTFQCRYCLVLDEVK